jgi:hypothetical protein
MTHFVAPSLLFVWLHYGLKSSFAGKHSITENIYSSTFSVALAQSAMVKSHGGLVQRARH